VRGQAGQLLFELGEGELAKITVLFSDNIHVGRLANASDSTTRTVVAGRERTWHGL
jgi:hypothetical protein